MANHDTLLSQVRLRVRQFLQRRETRELREFVNRVEAHGRRVALFGGTVRDLLLQAPPRRPRDIDLVVEGEGIDDFLPLLTRPVLRRTRFGGVRTLMSGYAVDVWTVGSTWGFKHVPFEPELRNLPLTTFLNAEAIAVELTSSSTCGRHVYDCGFFDAVEHRRLEINLVENPYPELSAVRSLHLAQRVGFSLGSGLSAFVRRVLTESAVDVLLNVQRQHYGKVVLEAAELGEIRNLLEHEDGDIAIPRNGPAQTVLPFSDSLIQAGRSAHLA